MSEWWTYRLSDFLLYAPRTYFRLFELYNDSVWPAQPLVTLLWLALLAALWRGVPWAPRVMLGVLALAWAWIAWAFHLQRHAAINWAATGFAAAFAVQALLLAVAAVGARRAERASPVGFGVAAAIPLLMPLLPLAFGRRWIETESFGLTPDATALATLAVLPMFVPAYGYLCRTWRWVPLSWLLVSGLTLWALGQPLWGLLLPVACILVVFPHWHRTHKCAH